MSTVTAVRRRSRFHAAMVVVCAVGGLLSMACHSGSSPGPGKVTVDPARSSQTKPVRILFRKLRPGRVTVTLTSTDAVGTDWAATADFAVGSSGMLDPAKDKSLGGTYTGVHAMGLVWSMTAAHSQPGTEYWWGRTAQDFQLTATEKGKVVASTHFARQGSAPGVRQHNETLAQQGFIGQFWTPAGRSRQPAVLEFGGSEGGIYGQLMGSALASAGYPVLDIGYFGLPGLPTTLSDIPLEYFAKALRWLGRQPGVDPGHIYVSGVSRGSEAAQLLGVHYPSLVHGVILGSPSDAAICSYPDCTGAAWSTRQALPYTNQFNEPHPTDDPAAVFPDERIHGPISWSAAARTRSGSRAATPRRSRPGWPEFRYPNVLYTYPDAGHVSAEWCPTSRCRAARRRANSMATRLTRTRPRWRICGPG